jgi:hypothetical protein
LSAKKADELRAKAHAALDAQLSKRLGKFSDRSQVSIDELEQAACDCAQAVGGSLLGGLLETDSWQSALDKATEWPCPFCGRAAQRAVSARGESLDDETTLRTRTGPVPWRAPAFHCRRCRRRFSPR